ncbi:MAG: hypothetical protein AAF125_17715, partial [Chloroflexota bacterium]
EAYNTRMAEIREAERIVRIEDRSVDLAALRSIQESAANLQALQAAQQQALNEASDAKLLQARAAQYQAEFAAGQAAQQQALYEANEATQWQVRAERFDAQLERLIATLDSDAGEAAQRDAVLEMDAHVGSVAAFMEMETEAYNIAVAAAETADSTEPEQQNRSWWNGLFPTGTRVEGTPQRGDFGQNQDPITSNGSNRPTRGPDTSDETNLTFWQRTLGTNADERNRVQRGVVNILIAGADNLPQQQQKARGFLSAMAWQGSLGRAIVTGDFRDFAATQYGLFDGLMRGTGVYSAISLVVNTPRYAAMTVADVLGWSYLDEFEGVNIAETSSDVLTWIPNLIFGEDIREREIYGDASWGSNTIGSVVSAGLGLIGLGSLLRGGGWITTQGGGAVLSTSLDDILTFVRSGEAIVVDWSALARDGALVLNGLRGGIAMMSNGDDTNGMGQPDMDDPRDDIRNGTHNTDYTVSRHTSNGNKAQRDLNRGREAHVFDDDIDLSELEQLILDEGIYPGEVRNWHRYYLEMDGPIGNRIQEGRSNVPLRVAELKAKQDDNGNWIFHLVPRTRPAS